MKIKRWIKRTFLAGLFCVVLLVVGLLSYRAYLKREGQARLNETIAQMDTNEPRWRYDDLVSDLPTLDDRNNSALLVPKFTAALGNPRFDKDPVLFDAKYADTLPNYWHAPAYYEALKTNIERNQQALAIASQFGAMAQGQRRYPLTPIVINVLLPEVQDTRMVQNLLDHHAEHLTKLGQSEQAMALIPAMFNVARSLSDEPFMISALVRIACDVIAIKRLERLLGTAEPKTGLDRIQQELIKEAQADLFWYSLKGERAAMHTMFANLRDGTIHFQDFNNTMGVVSSGGEALLFDLVYGPHMDHDHAAFLDLMTRAHEVRKLPIHEQRRQMQAYEAEIKALPRPGLGTLLTRMLTPAFTRIFESSLRTKAQLNVAVMAIAVERYRLKNGRWPASFAELPKDVPTDFQLDPFDGQPLRYRKRHDGVTVYSIGLDEVDDGGTMTPGVSPNTKGQDLCFRLYNPAQRGQPAVPLPQDDPPPPEVEKP